MEMPFLDDTIDLQIAQRLKLLRSERGWSLDELAKHSGVSRATLSRLENADVSATASVLGKLCAAYGMPMSRLMRMVEEAFVPVIRREAQPVWEDPETGFVRQSVSPPSRTLSGELLECTLPPGTRIAYDMPSRPGLEHHLLLVEGRLRFTIEATTYEIGPGDCLRYKLHGKTVFESIGDLAVHYYLFMV